jgi:hypothetical protein
MLKRKRQKVIVTFRVFQGLLAQTGLLWVLPCAAFALLRALLSTGIAFLISGSTEMALLISGSTGIAR